MELSDATQAALGAAMRGAMVRHTALASNLANVETPGYARRDVDFHSVLREALATGADPRELNFSPTTQPGAPMRADGNSVDPDVEAANIARNALEYEALMRVKSARGAIVKAAIGGN